MDTLSAENIQNVVSQAFHKAQLSINGSKPKPVAILANMQSVKQSILLHSQQKQQAPIKPQRISVDIAKLKYTKQLQSSR